MKFRLTTSGLQAAVLILLSAKADSLQCYWCGPLAEQVHRSQRAPACDAGGGQVTACDPGYTHCAVVASSPPFMESRYCVKFYQDECYTLYCNSTRTYRTTCPCRGELCNGPNTQREIDAFAVLAKAVAKTQNTRIKKRSAALANNLIKTKDKTAHLIHNDDTEEVINDTQSNIDHESTVENEITEHIQVSNFTDDDMMQADQPAESSNVDKHEEKNDETDAIQNSTPDDKETVKEMLETTTQKSAEIINANPEMMATEASVSVMGQTTAEMTFVRNDVKPSMELPTAEALQQNSDPSKASDKPEEHTTEAPEENTTTMTTAAENNGNTSPQPTKDSRNNAMEVSVGTWLLFNLVIITIV